MDSQDNTASSGRRIFVVGLGSLGSTFCTEIAKRSLALKVHLHLTLVDFDIVEERNVVAQDFPPIEVGEPKPLALSGAIRDYPYIGGPVPLFERITKGNINPLLPVDRARGDVLVDAVDNFETRKLLWFHAQKHGVPLLHLSMSKRFGGHVQWTYSPAQVDTWGLSPKNLSPAMLEALENPTEDSADAETLPPCVLNSKRGLIWNTAMAGVNALFIALGHDTQEVFAEALEGASSAGLLSTWESSVYGYQPCYDRTEIVTWTNT